MLTNNPGGLSPGRAQSPSVGPVQAHEIVAALPASGIAIGGLMKLFGARVSTADDRKNFIRMVKENSKYGGDKLLRPK